jgi:hypothetical protein
MGTSDSPTGVESPILPDPDPHSVIPDPLPIPDHTPIVFPQPIPGPQPVPVPAPAQGSGNGASSSGLTDGGETFPSQLDATKAQGIDAIRISLVQSDLHLEGLGAGGQTVVGFVFHPLVDNAQQVTAIAVTRMGSTELISPLAADERAELSTLLDELSQVKASSGQTPPGGPSGPGRIGVVRKDDSTVEAVGAALACTAAFIELGANPIADASCIFDYGALISSTMPTSPDPDPVSTPDPDPVSTPLPDPSSIDLTTDPGSVSGDDGSGGGSGGGGGPGDGEGSGGTGSGSDEQTQLD